MSPKKDRLRWIGPLLCLLIGLFLTVYNLQGAAVRLKRMKRKGRTLQELASIESVMFQEKGAYEQYMQEPNQTRSSLESTLTILGSSPVVQSTRMPAVPLLGEWKKEPVKITGTDLPLNKLTTFLDQAAALRPPWILEQCDIKASEKTGRGDITLVLQTVYRDADPNIVK